MFMPEVKSKPKLGILTASRNKDRKVMQLLTGHNNLDRHRFSMKMEDGIAVLEKRHRYATLLNVQHSDKRE